MINLKRAYDRPAKTDGRRVLVDRLWPRGVEKAKLKLDTWEKELAPSAKLRMWFGHKPERWDEFRRRYTTELQGKKALLRALTKGGGTITLVYGAKDSEHTHALVLKEMLEKWQ